MYVKDNVKDASFVQDRRTKSTDLLAVNVTTPSAKNTARLSVINAKSKTLVYCALHYIVKTIKSV